MKTSINGSGLYKVLSILVVAAALVGHSCKSDKKSQAEKVELKKNVVQVITENMDFQMADTIFSGWNTFSYHNLSTQTHFILVDKYPPGKTSEDAENVIAPIFDAGMKLINQGKMDEAMEAFGQLPEWFSEGSFWEVLV